MKQITTKKLRWLLFGWFFLFPFLPVPAYWITIGNYIGLYSIVALGLVLLTGIGGLTSFLHHGLSEYGIGLVALAGAVCRAGGFRSGGGADRQYHRAAFRAFFATGDDCLGAVAVLPVRHAGISRQVRWPFRHSHAQPVRL